MTQSNRDPEKVAFARGQRQQANEFARDVWQMVRSRRMLGEKFRREHPVGPYTLDFVCLGLKLGIEVDGKDHLTAEGRKHDQLRDAYLQKLGFTVLRIPAYCVTQDPLRVRSEIEDAVKRRRSDGHGGPSPSPPAPSPRSGARGSEGYNVGRVIHEFCLLSPRSGARVGVKGLV